MTEPFEPVVDERRAAKLHKLRKERMLWYGVMALPGAVTLVAAVMFRLMNDPGTGFGIAVVAAWLTVPWTGVCAACLTGTMPELRGTGFRRVGAGLLIWLVGGAVNAAVVGTLLLAGGLHLYNRSY